MRLIPLVLKCRDSRHLPTNSAVKLSMEAAVRSSPNKLANGVVASLVWLVFHAATGPEVISPVYLRRSTNLELLLPDFGTQGIWI